MHPPLLDKEMVTLFANMLKASYYKNVMGSLAQQFTDVVAMAQRIEQGVRSGRISASVEKKGFRGKMREVDHVEGGYRGKKKQFQNYHISLQITNNNFNSSFPARKPEPQIKNQIENLQRVQEQLPLLQLPLNKTYQKLLSIKHVTLEPLTPLQPLYPN